MACKCCYSNLIIFPRSCENLKSFNNTHEPTVIVQLSRTGAVGTKAGFYTSKCLGGCNRLYNLIFEDSSSIRFPLETSNFASVVVKFSVSVIS